MEAQLSVARSSISDKNWQVTGRLFLADGTRLLIKPGDNGIAHISMMAPPPASVFASTRCIVQTEDIVFESQAMDTDSEPVLIHIMPAYPESTLKALGNNMATLMSSIGDWQNFANLVLQNSGIAARIQMGSPVKIPEPKTNKVSELLRETVAREGSIHSRKPGTLWDEVHKQRNATQSALVLLLAADWSDNTVGEAGSIPLPPRSDKADELEQCSLCFCPKKVGSLDIAHVFSHELGHLLGGMHDPETDMIGGHHDIVHPMFDYVCGYQSEDRTFTTTMSYPRENEVWIPYYSSSEQTWLNPKTGKRVATGIPSGKPGAADAAAFFRSSTRTISRYKENTHESFHAMSLDINPSLGGTLLPGSWGPYPAGSVQVIQATPRPGYAFDHWELDGQSAGTNPCLLVSVYTSHHIIAHFRREITSFRLKTSAITDGELKTTFNTYTINFDNKDPKQSGPDYIPGTEVQVDCIIPLEDRKKFFFAGWRVNGNSHYIQGYNFETNVPNFQNATYRLVVVMNNDITVEAIFNKK
ncbi:hypothetical protein CO704_25400 (plasmid) [Cedecea neteri]|uniref:Bacterial repeat domain-containing protein n=1 Tax=Cedecea neteri TaxID=158822 RepID=A0A291E5T3_9ENTR|nr:hypothetical protein CO704_25400 [Cedecea neteri]